MELEHKFVYIELEIACFTKPIKNSKQTCIVCMVDEDFEKEIWDRYQLKCGHQMHARCLREWCNTKQKVNCPYCGDVEDKKENYYCSICEDFGHGDTSEFCPSMSESDECFSFLQNS